MIDRFDSETTCLTLLDCNSENEVESIVRSTPAMSDCAWKPLDRRETNFNITSNQASDGGKALTELMTNMVDAVLLKYAHEKHIDPKGASAPQTMYSAVETLIDIKHLRGGRLVDADDESSLRAFALEHLIIGVTGGSTKKEGFPCFTFIDNGEGQHPEHFEETFLSLSAGNKKDIPFVQGKYNMGSSGVLGYCGHLWYKLIISRRYDKTGSWGWTLVRRRPGNGMPVAEYFEHNNNIPKFEKERMYPLKTKDGGDYDGGAYSSGTIIKLFDYQLGRGFSSYKGPTEALNENLVESILPFRILDFRNIARTNIALEKEEKRGTERAVGIYPRPFYGMEYLLLRSHAELVDDLNESSPAGTNRIDVGEINDSELGLIKIHGVVLKKNIPGWLNQKRSINRVFHSVNGQVQYKQTRGFLSSSCKLPALKDRVILFVDASNLTFKAHNDVWKGDRENIRQTITGEKYISIVTDTLKNSESLKELQIYIAQKELESVTDSGREELFQKLVYKDKTFANFLSNIEPKIKTPNSSNGKIGKNENEYSGKYSPTFIKIHKNKFEHLEVPINKGRPIVARTDVRNDYFVRSENKGNYYLDSDSDRFFNTTRRIHNGKLTLFLKPLANQLSIGDKVTVRLYLHDDAMPKPVCDSVTVKIAEPSKETKPTKPRKPHTSPNEPLLTHNLPKYTLLTKDGRDHFDKRTEKWPEDFDNFDGGLVENFGDPDNTVYKINLDNNYYQDYLKQQTSDISRKVITEKYILGMLITMLGFEKSLDKELQKNNQGLDDYSDIFRKLAASGAASVILTMVDILPKIVDSSSVQTLLDVDE